MSNRKLILAMLACLLVLVCTACGGGKDAESGTEAIDEPDTEISEEAEAGKNIKNNVNKNINKILTIYSNDDIVYISCQIGG